MGVRRQHISHHWSLAFSLTLASSPSTALPQDLSHQLIIFDTLTCLAPLTLNSICFILPQDLPSALGTSFKRESERKLAVVV